jgi:hypothetical protein
MAAIPNEAATSSVCSSDASQPGARSSQNSNCASFASRTRQHYARRRNVGPVPGFGAREQGKDAGDVD